MVNGELVEGLVLIKSVNEPVAIPPDFTAGVTLVAFGIGVAGEVEPPARPAFAIRGRVQQPVHYPLIRVGRSVVDKTGGLPFRWRQSGQVERYPADERGAVRFGRRFQSISLQLVEKKRVDLVFNPLRIVILANSQSAPERAHFRHVGLFDGLIRPVIAPFGSLIDPLAQDLNFVGFQGRVVERHPLVEVGQRQPPNHFAAVGVAGNNSKFARFGRGEGFVFEQQREPRRFFDAPVAGDAVFVEQRFYLGIVIYPALENTEKRREK